MDNIHIFVGGHARQNNGHAGIGLCFYTDPDNQPFYEEGEYIGIETQNSAVYRAILKALAKASGWRMKNVTIYTDNRLVVGQLIDNMSARAQNIVPLHDEVKKNASNFERCQVNFVLPGNNRRSKELARAAAIASPETITAQALQFEIQPGITGLILAFTPKLMIVQIKYKKGTKIAPHQHVHEQASYLLKGTLKYVVADQDIIMKKGAGLVVSGNALHQIEALEDTTEIVTYSPMRADLLKIS
ncbi:MAG: reverse transcriptase-like protein [Eubacteriales bacterium]